MSSLLEISVHSIGAARNSFEIRRDLSGQDLMNLTDWTFHVGHLRVARIVQLHLACKHFSDCLLAQLVLSKWSAFAKSPRDNDMRLFDRSRNGTVFRLSQFNRRSP